MPAKISQKDLEALGLEIRKRNVYIPNKGGHNYDGAKEFGSLIFVTEGQLNRFSTGSIYRSCAAVLKDASPKDWVMETGPSVAATILAACFARKFGVLNLLLFRDGGYVPRELDIDSLLGLSQFPDP